MTASGAGPDFAGGDAPVIESARARALAETVLEGLGAPKDHAAAQVDQLLEADLRGRASHGLQRLPTLAARIRNGVLDPTATPQIRRCEAGAIVVDGCDGFGPVAAKVALDAVASAAQAQGIACAAVRNAGHVGILATYVERLCDRGLIGVAFTTSEALVHPTGGRTAMLGTNPIGIGIPTSETPLVLDMSTGAISAGEIIAHAKRGTRLAPGRAVDADGRPTEDPQQALGGAISPFGGAKGYGLGLAIELLVAMVTGTAAGTEVKGTLDVDHRSTKGDVFIAIDPSAFGAGSLNDYLLDYLEAVRSAPRAPGAEDILVPGDRARAERSRRCEDGIPYPTVLWEQLCALEVSVQQHG